MGIEMIKVDRENTSSVIVFDIGDEEPGLFGPTYTFEGKKVFADLAAAKWHWQRGEWSLWSVTVYGGVQRNDGTRGSTRTEREAYSPHSFSWHASAHQWLKLEVEDNRPQAGRRG
jgi:hypothetical protein